MRDLIEKRPVMHGEISAIQGRAETIGLVIPELMLADCLRTRIDYPNMIITQNQDNMLEGVCAQAIREPVFVKVGLLDGSTRLKYELQVNKQDISVNLTRAYLSRYPEKRLNIVNQATWLGVIAAKNILEKGKTPYEDAATLKKRVKLGAMATGMLGGVVGCALGSGNEALEIVSGAVLGTSFVSANITNVRAIDRGDKLLPTPEMVIAKKHTREAERLASTYPIWEYELV